MPIISNAAISVLITTATTQRLMIQRITNSWLLRYVLLGIITNTILIYICYEIVASRLELQLALQFGGKIAATTHQNQYIKISNLIFPAVLEDARSFLSIRPKEYQFCDKYLDIGFETEIQGLCSNANAIKCWTSSYATETVLWEAINIGILTEPGVSDKTSYIGNEHAGFPDQPKIFRFVENNPCGSVKTVKEILSQNNDNVDYIPMEIMDLVSNAPINVSNCSRTFSDTTFLFKAENRHIFFKLIGLYNLHWVLQLLQQSAQRTNHYRIFQYGGESGFINGSILEQNLFPKITNLPETPEFLCFERLVIVPSWPAAPQFKCKMPSTKYNKLKQACFNCKNNRMMQIFEQNVLQACNNTRIPRISGQLRILYLERVPYARSLNEGIGNFERILHNSEDLINAINTNDMLLNLTIMRPEIHDLCYQINQAANCDVLIGMHGAALIHSSWMRSDALLLELLPEFHRRQPTFAMLASLTGKRYREIVVELINIDEHYSVDVRAVLDVLKDEIGKKS